MHIAMRILATAVAVYLTVFLVPGIQLSGGWPTILVLGVVWSVMVSIIKPVLSILTLPITVLTLGLSSFLINALLFWGMEYIVPGFDVAGFFPALFGSIVLSLFSWAISRAFE